MSLAVTRDLSPACVIGQRVPPSRRAALRLEKIPSTLLALSWSVPPRHRAAEVLPTLGWRFGPRFEQETLPSRAIRGRLWSHLGQFTRGYTGSPTGPV